MPQSIIFVKIVISSLLAMARLKLPCRTDAGRGLTLPSVRQPQKTYVRRRCVLIAVTTWDLEMCNRQQITTRSRLVWVTWPYLKLWGPSRSETSDLVNSINHRRLIKSHQSGAETVINVHKAKAGSANRPRAYITTVRGYPLGRLVGYFRQ